MQSKASQDKNKSHAQLLWETIVVSRSMPQEATRGTVFQTRCYKIEMGRGVREKKNKKMKSTENNHHCVQNLQDACVCLERRGEGLRVVQTPWASLLFRSWEATVISSLLFQHMWLRGRQGQELATATTGRLFFCEEVFRMKTFSCFIPMEQTHSERSVSKCCNVRQPGYTSAELACKQCS